MAASPSKSTNVNRFASLNDEEISNILTNKDPYFKVCGFLVFDLDGQSTLSAVSSLDFKICEYK